MSEDQFNRLMELLGNVGNASYQGAYAEAVLNGKIDTAVAMLCAVVFLVAVVTLWNNSRQITPDSDRDKDEWHIGASVVAAIVLVVVTLIGVTVGISAIKEIVNPSWQAIYYLSDLVKK